ncbi:uncharacterized protein N7459_005415 [Penicillium hispanicum]|uniref:uncharacterized protein n=1 Tax=Penicillium hispanicum TaxID=1080232 RepID=UPI00254175F7|nr:uncharacterized protein N7459_005415 [Penicillium hispanicum]KAJ5585615.1 hypothetical protein N7459_005415 [Penicillium hispanicum]
MPSIERNRELGIECNNRSLFAKIGEANSVNSRTGLTRRSSRFVDLGMFSFLMARAVDKDSFNPNRSREGSMLAKLLEKLPDRACGPSYEDVPVVLLIEPKHHQVPPSKSTASESLMQVPGSNLNGSARVADLSDRCNPFSSERMNAACTSTRA